MCILWGVVVCVLFYVQLPAQNLSLMDALEHQPAHPEFAPLGAEGWPTRMLAEEAGDMTVLQTGKRLCQVEHCASQGRLSEKLGGVFLGGSRD